MIRLLPGIVIAATVLSTTAIVQGIYALYWSSHHVLDRVSSSYDWAGAFAASAGASGLVLLIALLVHGLLDGQAARVPVPVRNDVDRGHR